ncbi:MAG: dihydrolipoyl dehydrogenase [Rhodobacteraceae bacterium]|uniref:Dihydrolipoamide dehydrogenase n=1 Tax=Salipiger profundus TaxID=1229727 RepID=A0A1U7D2U7_9RHOB|nr:MULTISPECIES: dihydrolipoyl dehydrogenase [Salipiger]APX22487.1 dihydrolipoamide dehydrogenase [Salipiger profundus]MAB06098.1 dihydrolipoyl dehydrogenase [Paracoccaceae bacterium]GGA11720.1 dihydrolipoyl dehydrogenase [Salipiger profundus]SFC71310.1 dihydrolipoamide dehydrogenase [Salipiger profundus]
MADLTCDVAVIGGGTAGLAAERNARKHGATTLLIDPEFAGTTCATVGCMPSKLLIAAARAAHDVRDAATFGIHCDGLRIDGPAVMARVREMRDDFAGSTREGIAKLPDGILVRARARFTSANRLELDDGRAVEARSVVIATGSSPMVPPPFRELGDLLLTNETIFELPDLPESLAVIGGGVIGLELAQAMARLGVRVALFDQKETLAGVRCEAVHETLKSAMARDMALHLGTSPEPSLEDGRVRIDWDGQTDRFHKVLVATGRPPNVRGLNLEATGLALDDHGMPEVNPNTMQCGDAAIFMAGDANGDRPLLHEASDEGAIAGRNAIAYPALVASERVVPFAITFTEPPLVTIGADVCEGAKTGTSDYSRQGRARVDARNVGTVRLHAAAPDGHLIGADLFCPGADHMGHMLALAIQNGMTAGDLLEMPFYHPTLEEGLKSALREICHAVPLRMPGDRDPGNPPGT